MATVFVHLKDSAGNPLTGAAPTLDYWDTNTPGSPAATGVAMTELVGGLGGGYFAVVATTDGREYLGVIDGGASASPRYQAVVFSGETDARIETDVPAILADTAAMQPTVAANLDAQVSTRATQADILSDATPFAGANIDATISSRSDFDETTDPVELLDAGGAAGTSAAELVLDVDAELTTQHGGGSWQGSSLTSQQVRDAMKLAPTAGPPAVGSVDQHLDDIEADTAAIEPLVTANLDTTISSVVAAIGALNDLSQADVQAAMTAQGYTIARAALLDNLDAAISTVTAAIAALNDLSIADIQTAMDNQGYTAVRAALLDNLDSAISLVLSTGGPGPWTTAAAGTGLTPAQAAQLFYVWTWAGADPANKMNFRRAVIGTPGAVFSDDLLVNQEVVQVDNLNATFEQQ